MSLRRVIAPSSAGYQLHYLHVSCPIPENADSKKKYLRVFSSLLHNYVLMICNKSAFIQFLMCKNSMYYFPQYHYYLWCHLLINGSWVSSTFPKFIFWINKEHQLLFIMILTEQSSANWHTVIYTAIWGLVMFIMQKVSTEKTEHWIDIVRKALFNHSVSLLWTLAIHALCRVDVDCQLGPFIKLSIMAQYKEYSWRNRNTETF